jgi:DMSO/TMAO reductase YedYZ molybdopterin-dependent catalytic subunit
MSEPTSLGPPADDDDSLVAKRQRFIARQIESHPDRVDVLGEGRAPMGEGPTNRHGRPRLPIHQREVTNWPVLDLGDRPQVDRQDWRLEVVGAVEHPVVLDWEAFLALPQQEQESDFHCVTGWSRMDNCWTGVSFRDLAALVVPRPEARFVLTRGSDRVPGSDVPYTTSLPLARALEPDVMLVHEWEGLPLSPEHGGPVRMITPRLYAWKGAKWIERIEFSPDDRLGFWELRGYSNTAEPWLDDRYST